MIEVKFQANCLPIMQSRHGKVRQARLAVRYYGQAARIDLIPHHAMEDEVGANVNLVVFKRGAEIGSMADGDGSLVRNVSPFLAG